MDDSQLLIDLCGRHVANHDSSYGVVSAAGLVSFFFAAAHAWIAWLCWLQNLLIAVWLTRGPKQ